MKLEAAEFMINENKEKDIKNEIDKFFTYFEKEFVKVTKFWIFDTELCGKSKTNNALESFNR